MIQYLRGLAGHSIDIESPHVRAIAGEHARLAGVMSLDAESNLQRVGVAGWPSGWASRASRRPLTNCSS